MSSHRTLYMDACTRRMSVRPAATRLHGRLIGLFMALLVLISSAGFLYLSQASTVAQLRYGLADTVRARVMLQEEIAYLRCQIASEQSIAGLEVRVEEMGFVQAMSDDPVIICRVNTPQQSSTALLEQPEEPMSASQP